MIRARHRLKIINIQPASVSLQIRYTTWQRLWSVMCDGKRSVLAGDGTMGRALRESMDHWVWLESPT